MRNSNYCDIHKNEIAMFSCSKCARNVCSCCALSASSFCPKCRGTNILQIEKKQSQNEIRNILATGFVLSLISILINTLTNNYDSITNKTLIINSCIFFALGISFASAIYYIRKTDTFDEFKAIPLIGTTLIKYIIYGSAIIGIPIIYFFYLVYKFFEKEN